MSRESKLARFVIMLEVLLANGVISAIGTIVKRISTSTFYNGKVLPGAIQAGKTKGRRG